MVQQWEHNNSVYLLLMILVALSLLLLIRYFQASHIALSEAIEHNHEHLLNLERATRLVTPTKSEVKEGE